MVAKGAWRKTCKIKSFKVKEAGCYGQSGYTMAYMDKNGLSYDHYSLVGVMGLEAGKRTFMYEATRW